MTASTTGLKGLSEASLLVLLRDNPGQCHYCSMSRDVDQLYERRQERDAARNELQLLLERE